MEERERQQRIERVERVERRSEIQRNVKTKSYLSSARQNALSDTNTNTNTNADIISTLPKSILTHILSLLSTQEAVATSILSSRWRTLWTLVPILDLSDQDLKRRDLNLSFVDVVSRIWTLCNATSNPMPLHTLRIHWLIHCHPFYVDTWVRSTIPHGLKELHLNIAYNNTNSLVELPRSVFYSTTLVALKLICNIFLNPPPASKLPSLRILQLGNVKYENSDSLSTLLTACSILQDLTLSVLLKRN